MICLIHYIKIPSPYNSHDVVHCVRSRACSNLTKRNRSAKLKMERELHNVEKWKNKWHIRTCPSKCNVTVIGTSIRSFNKIGGVKIGNKNILLSKKARILGYSFTNHKRSRVHATSCSARAKRCITKLRRFKTASMEVKLQLYKALVRPILEYPACMLARSGKDSMRKLQLVQNQACRFITNTKLIDHVQTSELHTTLKLDSINIRLRKLSFKILNNIRNNFLVRNGHPNMPNYKLGPYEIEENPLHEKSTTVADRVVNNIFSNYRECDYLTLPDDPEEYIANIIPLY